MKKILVAVDGSDSSIDAAKKALELASAMHAEVTLIHVMPPTLLPGDWPLALAPVPDLREAELAQGAAILKAVAARLETKSFKTLNLVGPPANVIADIASEQNFDLVVVGDKGKGAVSRVLLGSVADRLVHISQVSVLVVR